MAALPWWALPHAHSPAVQVVGSVTTTTIITYTYDPLSRLTGATYSGDYTYTFAYAYGAVGNRTAQTQPITSTQVTNYVYDPAKRLTHITATGLTWSASYNGDGARLRQVSNGAATTYTLDLAAPLVQVLVAKDNSGETCYLYGVMRIGEQQVGG